MSEFKVSQVSTKDAPGAIGPYSQGMRVGNLVYFSGQIPLDPVSGQIVGTSVQEQTDQVMKNILGLLKSQDMGIENIVKTTVFLKNMSEFAQFNETYQKYVKAPYPARSTVEVARLPKDVLVEIESIAYRA